MIIFIVIIIIIILIPHNHRLYYDKSYKTDFLYFFLLLDIAETPEELVGESLSSAMGNNSVDGCKANDSIAAF